MTEGLLSTRAAKEYLIERILTQARQDGVELSEVERKMLYFSETAWTLPDMVDVSARFDQDYEQDQYEAKIAWLVNRIHETAGEAEERAWNKAAEQLSSEDHYLLVLIDPYAGRRRPQSGLALPILVGAGITVLAAIGFWVYTRLH